ncbi:Hemimethylated DNA-binding protein YccV like-domain-containing protein [Phyllosticta citribraziliensis]|uniref:Hemimethylated DNA-binding protein YccV like-domain-containing protein n=1 Tax=Phyllosticta citribraziliensis TaxID=989973 RepID=A0ABR1L685_9PEZI
MAERASLQALPDEILTNILFYLDPDSLNAVQPASRRLQSVAGQEILWRHNCRIHFRHWNPKHNYTALLQRPVAQVPWRQLFVQRKRIEVKARRLVDELVATHKQRGAHIEWLAEQGYDVKDELLRQKSVDEEQEDVLARRYWANAALTAIHRSMAMEEWARLRRGEPTSLERVLGAYDLFVIDSAEGIGDLDDISARLDDLAARFKSQHPEYLEFSLRERALCLVEFLRVAGFTGVPPERYGRIEQNFIGLALAGDNHEALPLVTVAIFCCVAERLGINAQPCGYPMHIYAIVKAPPGEPLDGPDASSTSNLYPEDSDTMYLDPFRSEQEVPRSRLESQLMSWGASPQNFPMFLSSASVTEMVIRSARNMRRAVEVGGEAEPQQPPGAARLAHSHLDLNAALHAAMWAWAYLERGDNASVTVPGAADIVTHRRRILMTKVIQLILEHVPWETFLAERYMGPLFCDLPESHDFARVIGEQYVADRMAMAPKLRRSRRRPSQINSNNTSNTSNTPGMSTNTDQTDIHSTNQSHGTWASAVRHTIGTPFRHARYSYYGVIIGWDPSCSAAEEWVVTMDVDRLPHGRAQPFYNVLCEDSTARYVAEENIAPTDEQPPAWLRGALAGRYFLRWDREGSRFVSNVREEYPDD